ncbi:hypothetical protein PSPO01_14529 [Paraphaeosphaeria sporulosa]
MKVNMAFAAAARPAVAWEHVPPPVQFPQFRNDQLHVAYRKPVFHDQLGRIPTRIPCTMQCTDGSRVTLFLAMNQVDNQRQPAPQ